MSDSIPEWLTQGIKENNVSYNDLCSYLIDIKNFIEQEEHARKQKDYSSYIGKYYKEAYEYDSNGAETGYYYYKILGFNRCFESKIIFDTLFFRSAPEYVANEEQLELNHNVGLDTIGANFMDDLEEISEQEYREALHKHVDSLLDVSNIQEKYNLIDKYLGRK